jgi:asparagine synthetase B (glutamine-hydrolysing)
MCGILLVKSKQSIKLEKHLEAFGLLDDRGPDFGCYKHKKNTFIGQTVLHITGNDTYYNQQHKNFLAYNGEIYNYKKFGDYSNDIELVDYAVTNDLKIFKSAWGPWAWAWTDFKTTRYAVDPQGEKTLYQYQDDSILIVSSEIKPILKYVKTKKQDVPYVNKTWTMLEETPYRGIIKLKPGWLYQDGEPAQELDSVWSWIRPVTYNSIDEAYEEFQSVWKRTIKLMRPVNQDAALTYSGGMDSSLILNSIPNLELYAVNHVGKDPIVNDIRKFLTGLETFKLHEISVDPEQWADEYHKLLARTGMPALSWSYVGQWIVSHNINTRVAFTGCAADELFGGYNVYQQLNYTREKSTSPYSENGSPELWRQCLEAYDDPQQATLLMDYWHQVVGCDSCGLDMIAGSAGIETRNPYMAKPIMQYALNLPFKYKVSKVTKPIIRRAFLERWPKKLIYNKMGFAGHANDSLPWLKVKINTTDDRHQDWKQIARKTFYGSK